MKKIICLLLVLLLLAVPLGVSAAVDPVADMADLLTAEEEAQLTQQLASYGDGTVCVLTLDSLDGVDVEKYAENYAESNGIGVLLLMSMAERKWCITAAGAYRSVIDVYVIDEISAECLPYLQEGDYYSAFCLYGEYCAYYLENYDPAVDGSSGGGFGRFLICLVIGLAAGGITAGILAGKNRSVRPQGSAANYVRSDSMRVTVSRDIFLYNTVTRTPKPQNNSSGGSRGGGSRSTRSGSF